MSAPLLEVSHLQVDHGVRRARGAGRATLHAVRDVGFRLRGGEALAVVGESGSGKSTLVRAILGLVRPAAGRIAWMGRDLEAMSPAELRARRRDVQVVFQDPYGSLDPRMTVGEIVAEPLEIHARALSREERARAVRAMLSRVGLGDDVLERRPHELSGGQCQRVAIARALILRPSLLVCDEPVSALDVSVRAQIVALLADLRRELGIALLVVSHDLAVVHRLCDRVLVLYLGRMMELAPAERLYAKPLHPCTRGLLAAVPVPDPDLQPARLAHTLAGEPPSALSPPSGCVFRTRCPHAAAACAAAEPAWESVDGSSFVACHRWREIAATDRASGIA